MLLVDQTSGPYPHLLISAGKTGTIYVVNRDNMGQYNPSSDSQIVQVLSGILPNGNYEQGNYSSPVFFNGYLYFGAIDDSIKTFQLNNGLLSTAATSETMETYPARGGAFAISANGNTDGILWAVQDNGIADDVTPTVPGVLYAYNATNLAVQLYGSDQSGSRDTLDYAAKFSIPLVANGKVFVQSWSQLTVYGLLP